MDLIPCYLDEMTGYLCDSFGSDQHILQEADSGNELLVATSTSNECLLVEELVQEVDFHLRKTQINANRKRGEEQHSSPMVSLSADLLWTTHTTCQRGQMATKDQLAGLAIFQTSMIKTVACSSGVSKIF